MNQKTVKSLSSLTVVIILSLTFVGCNRSGSEAPAADAHAGHDDAANETEYVEGKGVKLSELGRVSVGLETAEVKESNASTTTTLHLQVFRHAGETSSSPGRYRQGYAYASVILPADQITTLKPGQAFTCSRDGEWFQVSVLDVDRQLESITGEAEIIAEIHDPENRLAIGSFAEGRLHAPAQASEDLVSVPQDAVLKTARGEFAYVINGEFFYRSPIKVIRETEDQALISEGLYEGDVVASRGVQQLYLIELQTTNGGQGCAHGH